VATESTIPNYLTHYYERAHGPLLSLSNLPIAEAERLMAVIRQEGRVFASRRPPEYLSIRLELEQRIRELFVAKGGRPRRAHPHYFILGSSHWLKDWYQDGCELRLPLSAFDAQTLSFTYGDSFPAMRYPDGKPYRGQVYGFAELPEIIARYGLPQVWNADGSGGPERYIEAQVWDEVTVPG
jgi:hypothetical protein